MRTTSWSPAPSSAPEQAAGMSSAAMYDVTDDVGVERHLSFFSTLYAVLLSLRTKLPCIVTHEGNEIFRFDGKQSQQTTEFGKALVDFEFYMLNERKLGYDDALNWMENKVKLVQTENDVARQATQPDGPAAVGSPGESPILHSRDEAATNAAQHPQGRRNGSNRRR